MLRSEFEQRVNYKVTEEEEFKSINEMYMDTDLDKDDFCLLYNASQFITQKVADVTRERKQLREEKDPVRLLDGRSVPEAGYYGSP